MSETGQFIRHLNESTTASAGSALTVDFSTNGLAQAIPLSAASCTLTFVAPKTHCYVTLRFIQDATGNRQIVLPASVLGAVPPLNVAPNSSTVYYLFFNGTNYFFLGNAASRTLANEFWVDGTAPAGGNGSEAAPFQTIQQAVDAAGSFSANIMITPGTYSGTIAFPVPASGQKFSLHGVLTIGTVVLITGAITAHINQLLLFENIQVTNASSITYLTGTLLGGYYLTLANCQVAAAITDAVGGALNIVSYGSAVGPGFAYNPSTLTGVVSIKGALLTDKCTIDNDVTCRYAYCKDTELSLFGTGHTLTTTGTLDGTSGAVFDKGCTFPAGWTYSGVAGKSVTLNDPLTQRNWEANPPTLTNATTILSGWENIELVTGTIATGAGAAAALDLTQYHRQLITGNAATCAVSVAAGKDPVVPTLVLLRLKQDSVGNRGFTFSSQFKGAVPTLDLSSNASTLVPLFWNGTNYYFLAASVIASGVTSFASRVGVVSPAAGDYAASQVNNDSATVSGAHVSNALDTLKSLISGLTTGVSSVFGRANAVVAVAGDYAASKINNDSATVAGTHVSDALDTLKALITGSVSGVSSVFSRSGAVVAADGDYTDAQINNTSPLFAGFHVRDVIDTIGTVLNALAASNIPNDSTVAGAKIADALNTLKSSIASLVTGVSSFNSRAGAVTPATGDYNSTQVTNSSTVSGTGVTGALNTLSASIAALVTGVSSFNSRAGAVVPATGDYNSTQVTNSSTVSGTGVTGALNTLSSLISGLVTGVSSVFGRSGAVTAQAGDYPASKINNDSVVTGTHVSDALSLLLREYVGVVSITTNFTLALSNVRELHAINVGSSVTVTIPTAATSPIPVGSRYAILLRASGSAVSFSPASGVTLHTAWALVQPTARYTLFHLECVGVDEWLVTADSQLDSNALVNASGVPGTDVSSALDNLHDSSGILDASSAGGPSVFASLNTIWSTILGATSSQVANVSSVAGSTVTAALNTLLGYAPIGDITLPLNGYWDPGSGSDWSFSGGFQGGGHNKTIWFALGPIPPGRTLTAIKISLLPTSGHAGLPTTMPSFQLVKQDPATVATVISGSTVHVTAASVPAYEAGNQYVSNGFVPQTGSQSAYWLELFDEGGTNALSGLRPVNITITLA